MTRETSPTPRNSRPSLGAVVSVRAGASRKKPPVSPPSATRVSESACSVLDVTT